MSTKPVREGFHCITPYLIINDAKALIHFLTSSFSAILTYQTLQPNGQIKHAELQIGDSMLMISDSPDGQSMPANLHFYVTDVDSIYQKALQHGATSLSEPTNTYFFERMAGIIDPVGNHWWISTPLVL